MISVSFNVWFKETYITECWTGTLCTVQPFKLNTKDQKKAPHFKIRSLVRTTDFWEHTLSILPNSIQHKYLKNWRGWALWKPSDKGSERVPQKGGKFLQSGASVLFPGWRAQVGLWSSVFGRLIRSTAHRCSQNFHPTVENRGIPPVSPEVRRKLEKTPTYFLPGPID